MDQPLSRKKLVHGVGFELLTAIIHKEHSGCGSNFARHNATATRAIFHPQLQCNFQKLLRCHRAIEPGYIVQWQNLLIDKLPEYSEFSIFLQLFGRCCIASAKYAIHSNLYVRRQCNNF